MAEQLKVFSIQELIRTGQSGNNAFAATKLRFEWDARSQSAPRPSWKFGISQRTVREDYPGNDIPTEQVLGQKFEPFTVSGVWDDRYARSSIGDGSGFAVQTWKAFERLVKRGNYVRIQFEQIAVTGLVTNATFNYRRANYIEYEFTVSPHFRDEGGREVLEPPRLIDPLTSAREVRQIIDDANATHLGAPRIFLGAASLFEDVTQIVGTWISKANELDDVINQRVLGAGGKLSIVDAFSRLVQSMASLKGSAQTLLTSLAAQASTANLAIETATSTLDFESWVRGLSTQARLLILSTSRSEELLGQKVTPKTMALYRPHSGESLYDISRQFYGSPHFWRTISDANGLKSFTLTGVQLLVIPFPT